MARYAEEIAQLFFLLELQQIEVFVGNLSKDAIRLLRAEVLPKIINAERRIDLRQILSHHDEQVDKNSNKASELVHSINDQLKILFDTLTTTILSDLAQDEVRTLFLERATDDELFILQRKLSAKKEEQEKTFHINLEAELKRRKKISQEQGKSTNNEDVRNQQGDPQWEANVWQNIINDIRRINVEVSQLVRMEPQEPQKTEEQQLSDNPTQETNSYKLEITEHDKTRMQELRIEGAQRIANITGVVRVGEAETVTEEGRLESMMSRFGMVLASQMVAGTQTNNHRILYTVLESLTHPKDSDAVIEIIQNTIKKVIPDTKAGPDPLKGKHVCATGGNPEFVTAFESEVVKKLLQSPEHFSQYGLNLSEKEREQIEKYQQNLERSRDLSNMLTAICYSWGGYEKDPENKGYKKGEEFNEKQQKYEERLAVGSKALQEACSQLKDNESLYLETGVENHSMVLVIKKIGNEFKLSTYDSSGALENASLSKSNIGVLQLSLFKGTGTMKKNAYSFSVPQERLISAEGLDYLSGLIRSNSMAGWAQTHINHKLQSTSREERSHMGWIGQVFALREQRRKYVIYMDHFGSLASPQAPPKFESLLQNPQNTSNCFAKKAQSCELYELGRPTYKKFRLAMLLEQKERLFKDIEEGQGRFVSMEYVTWLKNIEPEYLSPSELHAVSMRLCEVNEPPSKKYYSNYFQTLLNARNELTLIKEGKHKLAIKRIDDKIANYAKSYYFYLKKGNRETEIKEIFSSNLSSTETSFNWDSGVMPLKINSKGEVESKALDKLSEYAAAQAWKAAMQLLNHQIKKLSANERHINSPSERLPRASYRQYPNEIHLEDLENANVIRFPVGFTRTEEIGIEISTHFKDTQTLRVMNDDFNFDEEIKIGGGPVFTRKEINPATFFTYVVNNKEALTNPKVISLLEYLRNASANIEIMYIKQVYPAQRKAFEEKLEEDIERTTESIQSTIIILSEKLKKLELLIDKSAENISLVEQEIKDEQRNGEGKKSVKLKNLELRLNLLKKEYSELIDLKRSGAAKVQNIQLGKEIQGSAENKIDKTRRVLEKIKGSEELSINKISRAFLKAELNIEQVKNELDQTLQAFEFFEVELEVNNRLQRIAQYRKKVINHLQTNAEYRIVDELALGRVGTEKERNREIYRSFAADRAAFIKQGRNTFLPGSVFQEIQRLNQKLKAKVDGMIELQLLLDSPILDQCTLDSLVSANDEYLKMDKQAQELSKQSLPKDIKEEWVLGMFAIWLKHQTPEQLYAIQKKYGANPSTGINRAFQYFIEQKANIKDATLKEAGYPIELDLDKIEKMGLKPIAEKEIEDFRQRRKEAASILLQRFKRFKFNKLSKPNQKILPSEPAQLINADLEVHHQFSIDSENFAPPEVVFLSQLERQALDGSTLSFLRKNPAPYLQGESKEECEDYFKKVKTYLHQLKTQSGLENKAQRITEFCYSSVTNLFNIPYSPPQDLLSEIAHHLIDNYRNDENSLNDTFLKLENSERAQILTALIKLSLSQIAVNGFQRTKVNSKFYSTLKQWEKLIVPADVKMSKKISQLMPGGTEPRDIDLLIEVDRALHQSPVTLEGLYEGQKGLQVAITAYGKEKIPGGADENLRKLADRLAMRNGDSLLAQQFLNYYSQPKFLFSNEGVNSTQGRELFSRALLAAFQQGAPSEKQALLIFVQKLEFNDESEPCILKTSHQAFIDEVLLQCSNLNPQAFKEYSIHKNAEHVPVNSELLIESLTQVSNIEGTDRLFGFAKEINILALQLEYALNNDPIDISKLDILYSKLICSNLAYQLLFEQASEESMTNLQENFEFTREMSLVQTNIYKLQDNLVDFSSKLTPKSKFFSIFSQYVEDKKFDGPPILAKSASAFNIPGFISLGGNRSLDVIHGVVYVDNNRLGMMPNHLQTHIAIQELKLNQLPFRPFGGGYAYSEGKEIKAFIMYSADGTLTVQRELMTFDGSLQMLQYISPEKMVSLPIAFKRRLNAEHFFIDSKGNIHAYNSDFRPILKLSRQGELWSGVLLDHNGNKTPISFGDKDQNLSQVFPQDEMIKVNQNTVYIPSIAKYVIANGEENNYLITESLIDSTSRKHLKVTEQGLAITEKELTAAESTEVLSLQRSSEILQEEFSSIKQSDLLSKQAKTNIEKKIKDCESRIHIITEPENFIFISDSKRIQSIEKEHLRLQQEMQQAYSELRKAGKKDREKLSTYYENLKSNYLQNKKSLQDAYAEVTPLRTFEVKKGCLQAKNFVSIFHVGLLPSKTELFSQLLGANVLKTPLTSNELDELRKLKEQYKDKLLLKKEERFALMMIIGTELQHLLLERSAAVIGKLENWDRAAHSSLLTEFMEVAKQTNELYGKPPLPQFIELWRAIQSEFSSDEELQELFSQPVTQVETGEKKPVNLNTNITNMPIETMGARTLIQFNVHENPQSLLDSEQVELEQRLRGLEGFEESIRTQEEGYYYENYGLFNINTLDKLFSISSEKAGIEGLTKAQVAALFELMQKEEWIRTVEGKDRNKYQLTGHPSEFYSSVKIASYLTEIGFERSQIRAISDRLEVFLYQTAVCGGSYSIKTDARDELLQKITEAQEKFNLEYLEALDKIESILAKASAEIPFADLNAAYLLNDYSSILSYFAEEERTQAEIVLNNAMTRLLYYKTELDHLNDTQFKFKMGQDATAIAMLHIRRNYQLDKLFDTEFSVDETLTQKEIAKIEEERKMQRAFLLFESEFGHRCNARQVNIFRGLLLDDETDPDKIDSAQARMGFGKTSLLPLVALYKTGDKLVRFIVPKSALETNTVDISTTLTNILGRRAIKDDFQRYRIAIDSEPNMGEKSLRLQSLQTIKADLHKRLALYQRVRANREVLVQSPSVRNAMECQAKVFLDLLMKMTHEPLQQKALLECIFLLNEIRSITTVSVFDELDATQDPATTEVNYTAGEKISFDTAEIYPLEVITQTIIGSETKSVEHLAKVLLGKFGIEDKNGSIFTYVTSLQVQQPPSVSSSNSTEIYLIRAILSDPIMLSIFTEKEPGTDFGVWFENAKDGSRLYDYEALKPGREKAEIPLLIAIPYSAANTPKPQGSRFDNPEVTAITTFLYYLDPRTEIQEVPHLKFLIDSFRKGLGEAPFLDSSGELNSEFKKLVNEINSLAEIEDPLIRDEERKKYFSGLDERIKKGEILPTALRKMLARTIIQEQIKFDAGKANSNRYEQGTTKDLAIGFSGTAGDTSSHFKENKLDPAADGNMTLGIMGRNECQTTIPLDMSSFSKQGEDYTSALIKRLAASFTSNTRVMIDAGGLCKASNRAVAHEIALQLKESKESSLRELKGVIFYDDVTNTKKLLILESNNKEKIVDLTPDMITASDQKGSYFTYYDQSHSRGADIKQVDKAQAVLMLNFTVTNNDYKQAIMRMRKIVDRSLGQSFSIAVPDNLRDKILSDLGFSDEHILIGNDIAVWLRQKELQNNLNNISLFMMEIDSIIKNAILQQQAEITQLMSQSLLTEEEIEVFNQCISALNNISPFISGGSNDLLEKYGKVYGKVKKEDFVADLQQSLKKRLTTVFDVINRTRESMKLPLMTEADKAPYTAMEKRIIQKRQAQLNEEFVIPSTASALTQAHSETESQSESQSQSQSQSQTQTHSFSEVASEEIVVDAQLRKDETPFDPVSIGFLSQQEKMNELALASQTAHLHHLFNEQDFVRCSPTYNRLGEGKYPLPPVRYFLAREEGNPQVILINQDEANSFKSSPVAPWSLYDIRIKKSDKLVPLSGPSVASLNNLILKKLYFSSFRHQVTGNDIESLAKSFEGICTPEQFHPSLSITYQTKQNVSPEDTFFNLANWGFYGDNQQTIQLKVEQIQIKFKDKFEKRGVTISVGQGQEHAEVFISSKLNRRILAEVEKQEEHHSKLKTITEQVIKEYESAREQRQELRNELKKLKTEKEKIIRDADQKIAVLQAKKEEAIRQARMDISKDFDSAMKNHLNRRKIYQVYLAKNVGVMCRLRVGDNKEYGIKVFGKTFPDLKKAITYAVNELDQENKKKTLSDEELDHKLDSYIEAILQAAEERYQNVAKYRNKTITAIESLHAASKEHLLSKDKIESLLKNELQDVKQLWMNNKEKKPEEIHKKWNQFVNVIEEITNLTGKNLTLEDFHQKIVDGLKEFAVRNSMDIDKLSALILPRLCYSLTPSEHARNVGFFNENADKTRNIAVTKSDIANFLKKGFLEATNTPSEVQMAFFGTLNDLVKRKINPHQYDVPAILLEFEKAPISRERIEEAVKQALTIQNVRTIKTEIDLLAKECSAYLIGRKALETTLDHYQPVENRSSQLDVVDGQETRLVSSNFERLAKLDIEVLPIQKQLEEAQAQKKAQLAQLEKRHVVLREELAKSNEKLAELKIEKSAINKLHSGLKKLLSVFTNHQVNIKQDDPIDFLDQHFDLGKIIRAEISSSTTLTFIPPEFYEVEKEMQEQFMRLHGIAETTEKQAQKSLDRAVSMVKQTAATIQERKWSVENYTVECAKRSMPTNNAPSKTSTTARGINLSSSNYPLFFTRQDSEGSIPTNTEAIAEDSKDQLEKVETFELSYSG